ncbi:hypothetical protein LMG19083_04704 [Ralstonia psammae]|uniref:LysR substrate-binding domain-containing protein n=1 Tax=Ralstonia psammae TaxID=3058598 RepID=A0ABM9JYD9_9RALS|nr:substrate binding domain-containing protein [Ralstonia sp. LMG 19083]CAJ0808423.1 hypothetical protein LMG19083_04704 [Ralstonia sp. LMG 19083]
MAASDIYGELARWLVRRENGRVAECVDVGFRIGSSTDGGVIARRLFPVELMIFAAPSYLERHGVPRSQHELAAHSCSAFRHPATGQVLPWYLNIDGEIVHRHVSPMFATNDTELEIKALLAGQVIGQAVNLSVAEHIRAGRLVPLLLQHMSGHTHVHVYYGTRAAQPRRVRAFIDLAVERLHETPTYMLIEKKRALATIFPTGKVRRLS